MKQKIVIIISVLFVFAVLLACCIQFWITFDNFLEIIAFQRNYAFSEEDIKMTYKSGYKYLTYSIFTTIATLLTIVVGVIIALKEFPTLMDKYNAHKEKRSADKAVRNEKNKQQKIQALEKQLEELKKD